MQMITQDRSVQYEMFSEEGNLAVAALVEEARELAGLDGPINPMERAWNWLENELYALSRKPGFEEASDTAVREAAYDRFI